MENRRVASQRPPEFRLALYEGKGLVAVKADLPISHLILTRLELPQLHSKASLKLPALVQNNNNTGVKRQGNGELVRSSHLLVRSRKLSSLRHVVTTRLVPFCTPERDLEQR